MLETFKDEFIRDEISRLEDRYWKIRETYDTAVTEQIDATPDGEMRHYYLPYDHPLSEELRHVKERLDAWKREIEHREATRFIKRVTTFAEEIQLNWSDLYFLHWRDQAADWHKKHGITKVEIVRSIRDAMQPQKNWTDELIEEEIARHSALPDDKTEIDHTA